MGVGLDGRVEIAVNGLGSLSLFEELFPECLGVRLQLAERPRQALVVGALAAELFLHPFEDGLRFLLDFLGRDLRRRAGCSIETANQFLHILIGFGRSRTPVFYPSRCGIEGVTKTAEMLDGCLCLAGQQPAEQGGRFLCGVVAEFHRVRLIGVGPAGFATVGPGQNGQKTQNSADRQKRPVTIRSCPATVL